MCEPNFTTTTTSVIIANLLLLPFSSSSAAATNLIQSLGPDLPYLSDHSPFARARRMTKRPLLLLPLLAYASSYLCVTSSTVCLSVRLSVTQISAACVPFFPGPVGE